MQNTDIRKELKREYMRQWRAHNIERVRERHRQWYLNNKERVKESKKKWLERNPEKAKEMWQRHNKKRALKLKERRKAVFLRLGGKCYVCDLVSDNLHLHHKKGFENHPMRSDKRLKEAEEHPERFVLLCFRDHDILHRLRYFPEQKERLLTLI